MPEFVYLDNAATTYPKPPEVIRFACDFYLAKGVNPGRTGFDLALEGEETLAAARQALASFFGGRNRERLVFSYNVTDALNLTTTFTYDASGQLVITRDAENQETHFAYDAYGRVTDVTDPLGRVTHTEYDLAGNPRFVTLDYLPGQPQDEQNQYNLLSEFVYDERGRLTQTRRDLDETTTLTETVVYDDAGRIHQTLDALDQATTLPSASAIVIVVSAGR